MLPGAVGEDHGSRKASASSSKKKSRHVFLSDSSSPLPDIANIDIPDDEQTKNKSSTRGFFRKCQKTLRKLFSCGQDLQSNPPLVVEPEKREVKKVQGKANCLPDQVCISHKNNNDSEAAITNQPMLTYGTVVSNYKIVKCIGSGSFAKVYEGFHISDEKKKVAIKHVRKIGNEWYLRMPGHSKPVPSEVAMLLRLGSPPSCPSIIKLQHWVQNEKSVLLFMEMPERSMNLAHYMLFHRISERDAHKIITQLILAVKHCVARQIFHGDLHLGNILVSLPSLHIKLIDFGVASPYNGKPLRRNEYQGHCRYIPPEVLLYPIFEAKPAYVWGLGLVLYKLMHGDVPLKKERKIFDGGFRVKESLSPECRDLIKKCLIRNHWQRLQLENVEKHSWFGLFKEEPL